MDLHASADDFERFRNKARMLVRRHHDHPAVRKLRADERLAAAADQEELEWRLVVSGVELAGEIERAETEANGLGVFLRSLVGLDREAKRALAGNPAAPAVLAASLTGLEATLLKDHRPSDAEPVLGESQAFRDRAQPTYSSVSHVCPV